MAQEDRVRNGTPEIKKYPHKTKGQEKTQIWLNDRCGHVTLYGIIEPAICWYG